MKVKTDSKLLIFIKQYLYAFGGVLILYLLEIPMSTIFFPENKYLDIGIFVLIMGTILNIRKVLINIIDKIPEK